MIYTTDLDALSARENDVWRPTVPLANAPFERLTVGELCERYIELRKGTFRERTLSEYSSVVSHIKASGFGAMPAEQITVSQAKAFMAGLRDSGKAYSTINNYKKVLLPAFRMLYDDGVINRNPFDFSLSKIVQNKSKTRSALSDKELEALLDFAYNSNVYRKHYDLIVVLAGTGLRVSELCGLTVSDVDFASGSLYVTHQLQKGRDGRLYINEPKTSAGIRRIPMSAQVRASLQSAAALASAQSRAVEIDGRSGFLFLNSRGTPLNGIDVCLMFKRLTNRYNSEHEEPLPDITPHVLRHTFCTRLIASGANIKTVQYLMGHASTAMTLDRYTHFDYNMVEQDFARIEQEITRENISDERHYERKPLDDYDR